MGWACCVERLGEMKGVYRVCWRNLRERDSLKDPDIVERILLKSIFKKWEGKALI
jgi:hypothetical protein